MCPIGSVNKGRINPGLMDIMTNTMIGGMAIGLHGARTTAYNVVPDVAIAVDSIVTHAPDDGLCWFISTIVDICPDRILRVQRDRLQIFRSQLRQ